MYLNHVHNFRAVAICGIVGAHALHNFSWPHGSLTFRIFDSISNESSIWFFFIAGFLFQYLLPKYTPKKYWESKAKNVFLPYLIMSIPALYVFTTTYIQNSVPKSFYTDYSLFEQIGLFLVTGKHLEPFWFVPAITCIYLLAPLLIWADRMRWPYLALPGLIALSIYLGRGGVVSLVELPWTFSQIGKATYLLPAYMFGMLCSRYHDEVLALSRRYLPVLATGAAMFFIADVLYPGSGWRFAFKLITCPLLLLALHRADDVLRDRIAFLGTFSFGLFFVHGYVLAAEKMIWAQLTGTTASPPGDIASYLVFTAATIALCAAMLWTVQRVLRQHSRLVVGS
jgi:peptidoglycan/LPS O-acetylase OafA/YrhL